MAIGNPITLTNNVASKIISVTATDGQTSFTVTGGYRINQSVELLLRFHLKSLHSH
jgi:hypothetical protein